MPNHNHPAVAGGKADSADPSNRMPAIGLLGLYGTAKADPAHALSEKSLGSAGHQQAHQNMMPFQSVLFIIALVGIYPSRS